MKIKIENMEVLMTGLEEIVSMINGKVKIIIKKFPHV